MPAIAQVASVDVELDSVKHPPKVRGVGGLTLGRVPVLCHAVAAEVSGGGR